MIRLSCMLLFLASFSIHACELTMGYRTSAKPPLIGRAPDNSGLYKDLFEHALKRMGCQLQITRQPKKRVLQAIKAGKIDFYPGLSVSKSRSKYVHFLPNGLIDRYVGITRANEPELTSMQEVADRNLSMVVAFGGWAVEAESYGIEVKYPREAPLARLIDLVVTKRADFHAYTILTVQYYLQSHKGIANKLKIHNDCCQTTRPMYFAFSKKSPYIKLIEQPSKPNMQTAVPHSVASKLSAELALMLKDGTIHSLYQKHFNGWSPLTSATE